MFIIAGLTLRPVLALALVSQTLTLRPKLLHQGLGKGQISLVYIQLAD